MGTLADEALVEMWEKAARKISDVHAGPLINRMEGYVECLATTKACEKELQRRGKGHLLDAAIKRLDDKD